MRPLLCAVDPCARFPARCFGTAYLLLRIFVWFGICIWTGSTTPFRSLNNWVMLSTCFFSSCRFYREPRYCLHQVLALFLLIYRNEFPAGSECARHFPVSTHWPAFGQAMLTLLRIKRNISRPNVFFQHSPISASKNNSED